MRGTDLSQTMTYRRALVSTPAPTLIRAPLSALSAAMRDASLWRFSAHGESVIGSPFPSIDGADCGRRGTPARVRGATSHTPGVMSPLTYQTWSQSLEGIL